LGHLVKCSLYSGFEKRKRSETVHFPGRSSVPKDSIDVYNAYLDAIQEPYGYLLLDLTQSTNDGLRFCTKIFPYDIPPLTVYSYVGDKACEDELSLSASAEAANPKLRK